MKGKTRIREVDQETGRWNEEMQKSDSWFGTDTSRATGCGERGRRRGHRRPTLFTPVLYPNMDLGL